MSIGIISECASDWPGYTGRIPERCALTPEVLNQYGYATGAWDKSHNTRAEEPG